MTLGLVGFGRLPGAVCQRPCQGKAFGCVATAAVVQVLHNNGVPLHKCTVWDTAGALQL